MKPGDASAGIGRNDDETVGESNRKLCLACLQSVYIRRQLSRLFSSRPRLDCTVDAKVGGSGGMKCHICYSDIGSAKSPIRWVSVVTNYGNRFSARWGRHGRCPC